MSSSVRRRMEITEARASMCVCQTLVPKQVSDDDPTQAWPLRELRFGLELETALAKAQDTVSTYLTPHIVTGEGNVVFHCEWDNLKKTTTNAHGNNIVNSAGGIMLQEIKPGFESSKTRLLPIIDKSQQRSLKVDTPETLPPLHFTRVGPTFPDVSSFSPNAENYSVYTAMMQEYYV